MPRPIATYTAGEWLKLRPLTHGYKSLLWDRMDRRHTKAEAPEAGALDRTRARLAGKNFVASIAFNSPWTISWQLRFVGRHLANANFLVADNSTKAEARDEIARLCAEAGVAYIRLPPNPYSDKRHASRSHGLALNWVYRNIVRPLRPAAWGFFDHDLFPTQPFDPLARLRGQPFYGDLETRPGGRYLWPGYCFFAPEADRDLVLDFRQDWFMGLDTGGMSAGLLERNFDVDALAFARRRSIGPRRNLAVTMDEIDWFDDCVHLGNASGWYRPNEEREPALDVLLEQILAGQLVAPDDSDTGAREVGR